MSVSPTNSDLASATSASEVKSDGSRLCLACGLCCEGVLHAHAVVKPDEIKHVRALGLTVEALRDGLIFPLPCPLHQDRRCSIYTTTRPHVCGAYQCDLLKKFLAGTLSLEQGTQIVQRARELLKDVIAQLPTGYSFEELRRQLDQEWDSAHGLFGSAEMRRENAQFLLTVAKLKMYLRKHFGKPKGNKA